MCDTIGVGYFGPQLLTKQGLKPTAEVLGKAKKFAIYFSAHWCPPCRGFTPVLSEFYTDMVASTTDVEIIFVSSDSDESSFNEYYGSMPWVSLPFKESSFKEKLASQFGIRGIPALIVVNADGTVADANGRNTVTAAKGDVSAVLKTWGL
mmetsp:Transcript_20082/g.27683  ORF Transcript_20082/g.27683 Transcript_20082/m.27683 type:complete len:150 (-) Transcript_20082:90-539(-)|eukprot:CAMPEP_0170057204 /NCGR_PEP_ID=MMETSP0019_2-20121128/301_1 /TAXON_ID=98059 /ORGANISM="Dinobryon sp., Strain UTEXLB2267" /LENGTH=149 /DNA_ID=CAMNT_0010261859 /DNA_START=56 /DNA_END=505 /DNA_ORIENTATION=+